jgi:polyisoprenoid-binding protein YceI/peroxiredoxin
MRSTLQRLAGAVLVAACAAPAAERTFTIDPVHSGVSFRIRHLYTQFTGRLNSFSGTLRGDLDKPETLSVSATVDVTSIDTANADRDKHLRNPDFFHVATFPTARFTSTATRVLGPQQAEVTGTLVLLGKEQPVTFTVDYLGSGVDHRKGFRAGFHATTTIDRTAFGMGYNMTLPNGITVLGNEVELVLDIEAVEGIPEPAPLAAKLADLKAKDTSPVPPEVTAALAKAKAEILDQKDIEGLKVGDVAPDFSLPDAKGRTTTLSELLAKGPVVVVFYRGQWCPFCNLQLRALEDVLPQLKDLGASLVGVTPQKLDPADADAAALSFPLVCDLAGDTLRAYKLLYHLPEDLKKVFLERYHIDLAQVNGEGRWDLPVTATYIIDSKGVIQAGMVDLDYTKRMEPAAIINALKALRGK